MSGDIFGIGKVTWIIAIIAALGSGWGYLQLRDMRAEQRGAIRANVTTEKANVSTDIKGSAAVRKSHAAKPGDNGVFILPTRD